MADCKENFLQEVNVTVKSVSDLWPDFCISEEKIFNPTTDYVISFYKRFLSEVKAQVQSVQPGDLKDEPEDMDNLTALGPDIPLYIDLVKMYNRLGSSFCLFDLYDPQPKRTRLFFEIAVNFLAFVKNSMEDLSSVAEASFQKITSTKRLRTLEQELLQANAENAEIISGLLETNQKLKIELEKIDLEYKNMKKVQSEEDKRYNERLLLKKNLEAELANLELELQLAENKEKELEELVGSEEDFENLKKTEQSLTNSLEHVKDDEHNRIDASKDLEENLARNLATLQHLNFDAFHTLIQTLHDSEEKLKVAKGEKDELATHLETLNKKKAEIMDRVNKKKQLLNQLQQIEIAQEEENIKTLDEEEK